VLSGVGNRVHVFTTSGVLSGGEAIVVGSAARASAAVTHATSGALVGSGAAVVGAGWRGVCDAYKLDLILDILSNRQELDPVTGIYTLYADDGVTVLKTALAWEDAAGTIPYRGRALQRLDAMT
jgi:hypothetical protein